MRADQWLGVMVLSCALALSGVDCTPAVKTVQPTTSSITNGRVKKSTKRARQRKPRHIAQPAPDAGLTRATPNPVIQPPSPIPSSIPAPIIQPPAPPPPLVIQHSKLIGKLAKNGVTDARIDYFEDRLEFAGRKSVAFFSVPFRMAGRFERSGAWLKFDVRSLTIRGEPASESRVAGVQAKLETLVPVASTAKKLEIKDGPRVVYRQDI